MTQASPPRTPKLVLERSYRAAIADVWDLWTTKDGFESWWGPQGFRAEVHELDARVGGALRYDMIADSPEMIAAMKQLGQPASHATRSRFSELARHQRLVLTNVIDFLPGVPAYESQIAVDFAALGDRVRMTVTLDGMHDAEWTLRQKEGTASQLSKLDQRFAGGVHSYLEIVSADADRLVELHQRVHGLTFGPPDADLGQARVATRDDGSLVGIRKPLADHETPITRSYLAVDDIQRAAKAAEAHGALIAYPPTQQGARGTFAIVIHGGAQLGLWQH